MLSLTFRVFFPEDPLQKKRNDGSFQIFYIDKLLGQVVTCPHRLTTRLICLKTQMMVLYDGDRPRPDPIVNVYNNTQK